MAVVRIKRPLNEEPLDTLLLACKRRKTEDSPVTSLFKFAATLSNQDESISKCISKSLDSSTTKPSFKTPNLANITEKLRAEKKLFSQNNRLKIVNCFRSLDERETVGDGETAAGSSKNLTIVEIESLPLTSDQDSGKLESDTVKEKYVYDIYYAPDCDLDENLLNNPMSCHALYDLVCEDYSVDVNEVEEFSDDSNDENNWRNDYPDEDPDSIDEDDMKLVCGMNGLNIGDANSLSSDDGEEAFVYGIDEPDCGFALDADYFGTGYAAYKRRVKKDLDSDDSDSVSGYSAAESDHDSD